MDSKKYNQDMSKDFKDFYSMISKDIKNRYKLIQGYFELKVFFIIYLSVKLRRFDYDKLIEEFDSFVSSPTTSNLKPSRKLIQPSFLNEVNSHFNINI